MNKKDIALVKLAELAAAAMLLVAGFVFMGNIFGTIEAAEKGMVKEFDEFSKEIRMVTEGTKQTLKVQLPITDGYIFYGFDADKITNTCADEDIRRPLACKGLH